MKNFNKGGKGLCPPHVETQCLSIRQVDIASLQRRKRRLKHTSTIQRGECYLFDRVSAVVRSLIGFCSRQRLVLFDCCSTALRQVFDSSSTPSRSAVEADPKDCRRSPEAVPNTSRSGLEEFPKRNRRNLGFLGSFMYRRGTLSVPLMYQRGTVDVLPKYYGGTKEVPTICTSGVDQDRDDDRGIYHEQALRNVSIKRDASCLRKRRSKHISTVQRGEAGIPRSIQMYLQMFLFNIRRGAPMCAPEIMYDQGGQTSRLAETPHRSAPTSNVRRGVSHTPSNVSHTPTSHASKYGRKHSAPTILLLCFLCLFNHAPAQPRGDLGTATGQQQFVREINGTVTDAVTKEPLVGVSLVIYVDSVRYVGRSSREGGRFDFRGTHITHGVMQVNHKGYIAQEIQLSPQNNGPYPIALQPDAIAIEEVEVISTGYFSVPKERATGSFTHIDQELFSRSVGSNVIDRLKDVVPGLTFNQPTIGKSTFFNEPSISIRGRSTIRGNAEPLIILDNFPYEGDINDINPEDIESVTILQDAAAASIWGARAGNGVIVLTSKSGKQDRPLQMTVRSDFSISAKPDLYYTPTMSMDDFVEVERFLFDKGAWNAYINQGYSYITPAVELLKQHRDGDLTDEELEARLNQLKGQDVRRDLSKYLYRPASLRKVSASFDGGGRFNTYYFSAGYDENRGTMQDNDNRRISLHARNSYRLWQDRLQFDVGVMFSKSINNNQRLSGSQYNVLYDRLADDQGNPLSIGGWNKFRQSYIDTAGNGLLKDWNYRPLQELGMNNFGRDGLAYQLSTGMQATLTSWLNISGQYRYNSGTDRSDGEWDVTSFQMRNLYNQFSKIDYSNGTVTSAVPNGGQLNTARNTLEQHNVRFQFNVDRSWSAHQFILLGGSEINSYRTLYEAEIARLGYQRSTETFTPIDLNARYPQYHINSLGSLLVSPVQPVRETTVNRSVLLFGNASYSYDRRYTATFSVRKDEANIFGVGANRRGKPFWSSGLLWHIHEEDFVHASWLQKLSLRATHGSMGNVSTASAYLTAAISAAPYAYTDRVYQSITTPPNPLLSWEKVQMTNFAVDFTVLQGKLSGSVEHYFRTSTDLLSQNPINPSSGVSSLYGNWSSMKGSGWDITLTSHQLQGRFSWSSDFIFSHIKDVVTDYVAKPSSDRLYLTSNIGQYPIEGKPLYGMYSFRYAGLDDTGDPLGYMDGETSKDYANIYNNTALSDYVYHGRATPATFGSLRNTFGYGDMELSFNLSYHLGYYFRQQAFSSTALYSVLGYGTSVFQSHYANRWQNKGDEQHTRIPAAVYPSNSNREAFYSMAEDHVQRGDHIRFRDIRLAYNLRNLNSKTIKGLQVYGYIDNLGVLWAANTEGYDPQTIPDVGLAYPAPRTFAFGIHLKI